MFYMKSMSISLAVAGLVGLCAVSNGRADGAAKTMPLATVQQIVNGLGLEDTGDKTTFVQAENQGKSQIAVVFYPFDNDKKLNIQANLGEIPPEKLAAIPAVKMLEYSGSHLYHFSIKPDGDKKMLYLELFLGAPDVTPQALRQNIDDLIAVADDTEALWRLEGWKPLKKGRL